jgi:glycosidase
VKAEAARIAKFWIEAMGVDGFRLDAVGHFFEQGESPRNGPETHPWLRDYTAYIRGLKPDAFTVGEVWDSLGAIRAYYPDQLTAYFAFPVADALVDAVRSGSGAGLIAIVERVQREFPRGRWASFQRNHDQTRTMTELRGDVPRAKLAATLLLTLPGIPFIYYGEEIGMTASKPDPRLRTPMPWTLSPAAGFTRGLPWEPLQPDSFTANVAVEEGDAASLLNLYRRLIHLRAAHPALGSAPEFVPLSGGAAAGLAYLRRADSGTVLVIANLGGEPLTGLALSSAAAVLPAGRYAVRPLLGRNTTATLRVGRDGRIRGWIPFATLAPFESQVLELSRIG